MEMIGVILADETEGGRMLSVAARDLGDTPGPVVGERGTPGRIAVR